MGTSMCYSSMCKGKATHWRIVLANLVFSFASTIQFNAFSELPRAGRRLLNIDKAQIHNLRVRLAKRKAYDYDRF